MRASYFECCCEANPALPSLGEEEAAAAAFASPARVRVHIFPYLSEQSSGGHVVTEVPPDVDVPAIPARVQRLFPGAQVLPSEPVRGHELAYLGSSLSLFLEASWGVLRSCNVVVTHRNFLANEVLRGGSAQALPRVGSIPNAGVVLLRVTQHTAGRPPVTKQIYFVRHCTSHHNASGRGDHRLTTCATVDALRALAARLRKACAPRDLLYGSSILPRAILSSIALQQAVAAEELEEARREFRAPRASREEVQEYIARHRCEGAGAPGSFCASERRCWRGKHVQK